MIRLSKASKMPCRSWSLEALTTCPASKKSNGELVDACKGCYATTGNYRFPNVKAPRLENQQDWKRSEWVEDMVQQLDNDRYFRWFDSGDMYSLRLAVKIYEVMKLTPWVKHWIPTRMHKFAKFKTIIEHMKALPNVSVRLSSDSVTGEFEAHHGSTIIPEGSTIPKGVSVCHAYDNAGKCGTCRKCWDKSIPVIGYIAHGKKMERVINIMKG
jgi:hypothetical protein